MVQETVQAVKEAEAKAEDILRKAQEQMEELVDRAKEEAKAVKENAVSSARERLLPECRRRKKPEAKCWKTQQSRRKRK